jgi:hypothetical protein
MTLTSDTSFAGKKLDAPSELTIAWGTRMFFDGLVAEFGGGVEARQGASQMRCQSLIARLTEPIDLAAPRKQSGAAAKIKELECLQSVALENTEYLDGKLDKFEHLEATQLNFWSQSGQMTARGPGIFRTCTRGESSLGPPQPVLGTKTPAKPSNPDQLFLTEVRFADRLEGDQRQQIAKFFGHVEAVRSPVAHHTESINSDSLSPNSMRIACSTLEMATKRGPEDRSYSVMVASDNVNVEADVFTGRADRVSYNQLHDRLVFESRGDAPATFYRTPRRGVRPDETKAFKIYYNLRTYDVKVEGALMLDLQERETDRRNSDKSPTKKR